MVLLRELADVLAGCDVAIRCVPSLSADRDSLELIVEITTGDQANMEAELAVGDLGRALRRVIDVAQIREIAIRYNINPAALEALLDGGDPCPER